MGGGAHEYNRPTASMDSNGYYINAAQQSLSTGAYAKEQLYSAGAPAFSGSARDTNAAITRSQWGDYKARFQPLEGQLQDGLTFDPMTGAQNTQLIAQNIGAATTAVGNAYDSGAATQQRNLSRMGIQPTEAQQSSIQRAGAISKAAATVDAENMTRNRLADRNQEIALGSITPSGRSY